MLKSTPGAPELHTRKRSRGEMFQQVLANRVHDGMVHRVPGGLVECKEQLLLDGIEAECCGEGTS